MRFIFIVLAMANIAFVISQLLVSAGSAGVPPTMVVGRQINKLETLGERGARVVDKVQQKKLTDIAPSNLTSDVSGQCQLVGPFGEILHAEYLVERLAGLEIVASVKSIEIIDGINYWVYLAPEMSEKEALRKLYEVQAKAIDSYIIPSGELANGISFGQFGNEKDALNRVETIRGQGYAAEIKEIPKGHGEVWVEINDGREQKVSAEQWMELLKEEKGIERRQNYCLGVAH